jgi:hypothetical protein
MPNRLARETSPYLLQHAHNPVDWFPWGEEALAKARAEDKPILLSIGYSACHWCHVMERESFEDAETAALLNARFVSIKVDREERPDLDHVYQTAVQVLGGHGGWPLTMFLVPDGRAFFGGTYYPDRPRHGMPSFKQVLSGIAEAYTSRRREVESSGDQLLEALKEMQAHEARHPGDLDPHTPAAAVEELQEKFDRTNGGFGGRPKFPNTMNLSLMLRRSSAGGGSGGLVRERVIFALRQMAAGGIYDHLGGGFHRYSTDERWLVPHFEKMLYDNALLLRLCAEAWQASGDVELARVGRETGAYLLREMQSPEGGFYATQDADSEGEEGRFFAWAPEELEAALGADSAAVFARAYGVREGGNFEHGRSVLHRAVPDEAVAQLEGKTVEEVRRILGEARGKLFAAREKRVKPFRDEKIIAGWNGLAISACAVAGASLDEPMLVDAAGRAAEFLWTRMRRNGRTLHSYKDGQASGPAFLDDVAFLCGALLDLHEASLGSGGGRGSGGEARWLDAAFALADELLAHFLDAGAGGFFYTADDAEPLVQRPKTAYDGAIPSGTAAAVHALLRLHALGGPAPFREESERTLRLYHGTMMQNPFGFAHLLEALDLHFTGATVVALTGPAGPERDALLRAARAPYLPQREVLLLGESGPPPRLRELLAGKGPVDGKPAAYVCRGTTCSLPVTDAAALAALMQK